MKKILFLSAIALVSLLSFLGCDDENKILSDENDKPAATDSISAADSIKISIALNCDSLSLYVGDSDTLIATVKNGDNIVDNNVTWSTDNASIAVVDSNGVVSALSVGSALITVKYKDVTYTCKVFVTERPVVYEYVDLGLSVKWATFNVGATKPEEYGEYYAWGETETKSDYSWSTYKWCNGSETGLTKYNTNSNYGIVDNKTILDIEDDVAHIKWGGSWRMPTYEELKELRNNCFWTVYRSGNPEFNGVAGHKVTSRIEGYTDRFIFLPAAGWRFGADLYNVGSYGYCWSSSLCMDYLYSAYYLYFSSGDSYWGYEWGRCYRNYGLSVRPVCE